MAAVSVMKASYLIPSVRSSRSQYPSRGSATALLIALLCLASTSLVHAQFGVLTQAVVNIVTVDAAGREIPVVPPGMGMPQLIDSAAFRVTRTGPTNFDMPVYYAVTGTASNGVDYARLSGQVTIPIGSHAADIEVVVTDDAVAEPTESVIVTLEPIACIAIFPPPPECYRVGPQDRASASIIDNDGSTTSNRPPVVRILAPHAGETFRAPAEILIQTETVDPDGYANTVEFFANSFKIGEASLIFIQPPPPGQPLYIDFLWQSVPAGNYTLTARTRDDMGAPATSAPVTIIVGTNTTPPPPTNALPVVTIVARDAFASEGTNFFGTNNPAVFVIQRSGPTNAALTVAYNIGGTASNGVDYTRIDSFTSIPAGRRSTRIVINPIQDGIAEPIETVVLGLRTFSTPGAISGYVIGTPGRAAATISDQGRPPCVRLPDHMFHLCLPRTNGFGHRIEVGTNLVDWQVFCTNVVVDGALHFVDPDAPGHGRRFFRVSPAPAPVDD